MGISLRLITGVSHHNAITLSVKACDIAKRFPVRHCLDNVVLCNII